MSNIITDFLRTEPHPLEDIRSSLDKAQAEQVDFITLLEKHHDYLKESIFIVMDKDAEDADKQRNLYRFFRLVEMHGKAEEEVLYVELRRSHEKEARITGFAAQDEHDVVFQLEAELLKMNYRETWNEEIAAKGKVAVGLVKNHIKEEETEIFPLSKKVLTNETMDQMLASYVIKCKAYLDESIETSVDHPVLRVRPAESIYSSLNS